VIRATDRPQHVATLEVAVESHRTNQGNTPNLLGALPCKFLHFRQRKNLEDKSLAMHTHFAKRTVMARGGTQPHENGVRVFYAGFVRPWA
jgi:hypothetical protein